METCERPLALVTGASSGIGAAFARRLAERGHDLLLVARRQGKLEDLAGELEPLGARSRVLDLDLTTPAGLARAEAAVSDGPPLEALVNCAGFGTRRRFVEIQRETTLAMVQLHVTAPVALTRAALPAMLRRGRGRIINVSSLASLFTTENYVTYSATKAYLNMFTEGLAAELRGTGVSAQVVLAGLTRTGFFDNPEFASFSYQMVPRGVWMSPEAVADAALGSRRTLTIAGWHNRAFVAAMRAPLLGRALGWTLGRLNERLGGLF
jgi:short-subunit dehydrogenase